MVFISQHDAKLRGCRKSITSRQLWETKNKNIFETESIWIDTSGFIFILF